jgi:hypothetical protein
MTTPQQPKPPGRPPKPEAARRAARFELRLTHVQRDKLLQLGGADWILRQLARARVPATTTPP